MLYSDIPTPSTTVQCNSLRDRDIESRVGNDVDIPTPSTTVQCNSLRDRDIESRVGNDVKLTCYTLIFLHQVPRQCNSLRDRDIESRVGNDAQCLFKKALLRSQSDWYTSIYNLHYTPSLHP